MKHLYKVYPRKDISGVLPNNKRIIDPTILSLNKREFIHCMNNGKVCAIINGNEYHIKDMDYSKAESIFEKNNIDSLSSNDTLPLVNTQHYIIDTETESHDKRKEESQDMPNNSSVDSGSVSENLNITETEHFDKNQNVQVYQSSSNKNKKSKYNKNKKYNNSNQ